MPDDGREEPVAEELTLPDLHDAIVDRETLGRLFADLETQTLILDVRLKHGAQQHAAAGVVTLAAARQALEAGAVSGVQIRYAWQAAVWCDTLLPMPAGVRLVRMKTPA